MEPVSLYRKYRPHNFDNLVGQDYIKNTLINALKNGRLSHAYLFSGPRGTGKTSTARLLSKAINCTNLQDGYEPCNECEFCVDINNGRLIDLIEIDAASNRSIDEVRDLKEKIIFAPTKSKFKIYIIDEAHMMTKDAFNALLKTLEEPPSYVYFVLATTEVHKIPETIISRCQRFDFKRINNKALMTRLSYIAQKEEIQAQDSALELISRYVDGGLRDAIGLLEQLTVDKKLTLEHVQEILGICNNSLLQNFYLSLVSNDTKTSLNIINELHNQGSDLKQFIHEFLGMLREKLLSFVSNDEISEVSRIVRIIEILEESKEMQESDIPQLPLEIAVLKITGNYNQYENNFDVKAETKVIPNVNAAEKIKKTKEPIKEKKSAKNIDSTEVLIPLTIQNILEKWPRITERVKKPSLKMSLRNGEPVSVDGIEVALEFDTKFHKDKVMEHENRIELESIICDIFKKPVKISARVKDLEIKSVVEDENFQDNSNEDLTNTALEIFGGEIVE